MTLFLLVLLAVLVFEYINGFHDTANAIATVVSTKVLTPRQAIVWAAFWNLVGALAGTAVANTISGGLVEASAVTMVTVFGALFGYVVGRTVSERMLGREQTAKTTPGTPLMISFSVPID